MELLQGERSQRDSLTVEEAGAVVTQAMDQSQRTAARRYLRLLRWMLTGCSLFCALLLSPYIRRLFQVLHHSVGVIGGADGSTTIYIGTATVNSFPPAWLYIGLPCLILILSVLLAVRVRKLEKKLKQ